MSDKDDKDYEVGYGKPPKNQFPKGKSGNPNGRPKGAKNQKSVINAVMSERLAVDGLDGRKSIAVREAVLRSVLNRALKEKDIRAAKVLMELDILYSPELYDRGANKELVKENKKLKMEVEELKAQKGGVLVVPAGVSMDEFIIEAEKQRLKMLSDQEAFREKMERGRWEV